MGNSQIPPLLTHDQLYERLALYKTVRREPSLSLTFCLKQPHQQQYLVREVHCQTQQEEGLFLEKIMARSRLNHPNITVIQDLLRIRADEKNGEVCSCSDTKVGYIVMPYSFKSLQQQKQQRAIYGEVFTEDQMWTILLSITQALLYLKVNDIHYTDIIPDNILIHKDGKITLNDPSLGVPTPKYRDTSIYGDRYDSPELIKAKKQRRDVSATWNGLQIEKNNVYALGVILAECGSDPVDTNQEDQTEINLSQVLDGLNKNIAISKRMKKFIKRMLHLDPTSRVNYDFIINYICEPQPQEKQQEQQQKFQSHHKPIYVSSPYSEASRPSLLHSAAGSKKNIDRLKSKKKPKINIPTGPSHMQPAVNRVRSDSFKTVDLNIRSMAGSSVNPTHPAMFSHPLVHAPQLASPQLYNINVHYDQPQFMNKISNLTPVFDVDSYLNRQFKNSSLPSTATFAPSSSYTIKQPLSYLSSTSKLHHDIKNLDLRTQPLKLNQNPYSAANLISSSNLSLLAPKNNLISPQIYSKSINPAPPSTILPRSLISNNQPKKQGEEELFGGINLNRVFSKQLVADLSSASSQSPQNIFQEIDFPYIKQQDNLASIEPRSPQITPLTDNIEQLLTYKASDLRNYPPIISLGTRIQSNFQLPDVPEESQQSNNHEEDSSSSKNYIGDLGSSSKLKYVIKQYESGARYEGQELYRKRHGFGKLYYSNGGYYLGEWRSNMMQGQGKLYYANKELAYDGNWAENKFHGQGRLYNQNAVIVTQKLDYTDLTNFQGLWISYEGEFREDQKNGQGKLTLSNQEVFIGSFVNDMIHGPGKYVRVEGEVVEGYWMNGILSLSNNSYKVTEQHRC